MATDTVKTLQPGVVIQGFRVVRVLGAGGFGVVYEGFHEVLNRRAAIKEFFPRVIAARDDDGSVREISDRAWFHQALRKFIDTTSALSRLEHPNIVRVHGFEEKFGTAYMIMDHVDGQTVGQWRRSTSERITEDVTKRIFHPILDAIDYMHAKGMLHRDISPDNVMLDRGDRETLDSYSRPVLVDFGALKQETPVDATQVVSSPVVHPVFSPPEQSDATGASKLTPASEVFSIAASMFHFVTNKPAVTATTRTSKLALEGRDPYAGMAQAISEQAAAAPPIAAFSDRFMAAIDRSLSLRPDDRPQSIAELIDAFGWSDAAEDDAAIPPTRLFNAAINPAAASPAAIAPAAAATDAGAAESPADPAPLPEPPSVSDAPTGGLAARPSRTKVAYTAVGALAAVGLLYAASEFSGGSSETDDRRADVPTTPTTPEGGGASAPTGRAADAATAPTIVSTNRGARRVEGGVDAPRNEQEAAPASVAASEQPPAAAPQPTATPGATTERRETPQTQQPAPRVADARLTPTGDVGIGGAAAATLGVGDRVAIEALDNGVGWFDIVAPERGTYRIATTDLIGADPVIELYDVSARRLINDDDDGGVGFSSALSFDGAPGRRLSARVRNIGNPGRFVLLVERADTGGVLRRMTPASSDRNSAAARNPQRLFVDRSYRIVAEANSAEWLQVRPGRPDDVVLVETIDLGDQVDTRLELFAPDQTDPVFVDDNGGAWLGSRVSLTTEEAGQMLLRLSNIGGAGAFGLRVRSLGAEFDRQQPGQRTPLTPNRANAPTVDYDRTYRFIAPISGQTWLRLPAAPFDYIEIETFDLVGADTTLDLHMPAGGASIISDDDRGQDISFAIGDTAGEQTRSIIRNTKTAGHAYDVLISNIGGPGLFSFRARSSRLGGELPELRFGADPTVVASALSIGTVYRGAAAAQGAATFSFTPRTDQPLLIETFGIQEVDTFVAIHDGRTAPQPLAVDDDGAPFLGSRLYFEPEAGRTYYLRLSNIAQSPGSYWMQIRADD